MNTFTTTHELLDVLRELGTHATQEFQTYTELDHGLQTAAILEQECPGDIEMQIAGLLHDIAHRWDTTGQSMHGIMGGDAVRGLLGERVAALVEGHVAAKRYLVAVDADYRSVLSAGSIITLQAQGETMNADEVARFERGEHFADLVALRRADDSAKVPGAVVPALDHWVASIEAVARAQVASAGTSV